MNSNLTTKSFAQLLKSLFNSNLLNVKQLFSVINSIDFIDDATELYNNLDIQLAYAQLPVVVSGDVLVKVLLLKQADSIVLAFPQDILETYKVLKEDPNLLNDKNTNFSLYAEIYGFDSKDDVLQQLIKKAYLYTGNNLPPFELIGELAAQKDKAQEDTPDSFGGGPFNVSPFDNTSSSELSDFGESDIDLGDPNIEVNAESYSKFKKQTNSLNKLLNKIKNTSPSLVRENIKIKHINNVLLIELDNKAIYETLKVFPKLAKNIISEAGELIRTNKGTQLLDSFSLDNKRYFTLAESTGNNFWITKNESIPVLRESKAFTKPIQDDIIVLNRSTIRRESRNYKPCKLKDEIVYVRKDT